jgi:hypothetical protein
MIFIKTFIIRSSDSSPEGNGGVLYYIYNAKHIYVLSCFLLVMAAMSLVVVAAVAAAAAAAVVAVVVVAAAAVVVVWY